MYRIMGFLTVFLTIGLPAFAAETRCTEPYAPEINVSSRTTSEEMQSMRSDTESFVAASDVYQACLLKAAEKNPSYAPTAKKLIRENQVQKERIGKAYNAGVVAHKVALK